VVAAQLGLDGVELVAPQRGGGQRGEAGGVGEAVGQHPLRLAVGERHRERHLEREQDHAEEQHVGTHQSPAHFPTL
jgi:hypothetical protein